MWEWMYQVLRLNGWMYLIIVCVMILSCSWDFLFLGRNTLIVVTDSSGWQTRQEITSIACSHGNNKFMGQLPAAARVGNQTLSCTYHQCYRSVEGFTVSIELYFTYWSSRLSPPILIVLLSMTNVIWVHTSCNRVSDTWETAVNYHCHLPYLSLREHSLNTEGECTSRNVLCKENVTFVLYALHRFWWI